jgi:hypothetical protein
MNKLKIALTFIVLAAIGAGIFCLRDSFGKPEKEKTPENPFVSKIEQEIEQLKAKPDSKFSRDLYNEIVSHINDFYEQNRLGNNQSENDQAKENLENKLSAVYTYTLNSSQNTETEEEKEIETPDEKEFENEFWELMYQMAPPSKANFDTWYKKGSKIPYTNKYKQFYNKYLSKSDDFEKLDDFFKKSVIDRKRVKEQLDELKKQIK